MFNLLAKKSTAILKSRQDKLNFIYKVIAIYQETIEALEVFLQRKFHLFDAQVGETACQIRAYKILLLSEENSNNFSSTLLGKTLAACSQDKKKLYEFLENFKILLEEKKGKYFKDLDQSIALYDFFSHIKLHALLTQDMVFIIECYFLAKYSLKDTEGIPGSINYNHIREKLNISQTQAKHLVDGYQKSVSALSCQFVLTLLNSLSMHLPFRQILPFLQRMTETHRQVLPAYYVSEILLKHALLNQKPIVLVIKRYARQKKIDTLSFYFVSKKNIEMFICEDTLTIKYADRASMVIYGTVIYQDAEKIESALNYKKRLLKYGLKEILLYNMAQHPQYSGEKLKKWRENPFGELKEEQNFQNSIVKLKNQFFQKQKNAEKYGCSYKNSSLFLVQHIFCDLMKNQKISNKENIFTLPLSNQTIGFLRKVQYAAQ